LPSKASASSTNHLAKTFKITDEIYQFKDFSRSRVNVVLRVDVASVDLNKPAVHRTDKDFALAVAQLWKRARVLYGAWSPARGLAGCEIPAAPSRRGALGNGFVKRRRMAKQEIYDAIIVGSGATGGWAAKELTQKGLKVAVLEAGRKLDPFKDYTEHIWPWELKFRGFGDRSNMERTQPIQSKCYACNEYGRQFFVNDLENPFTTPPDKPFYWIRSRHVGGRSIPWGRQSYRLSNYDFKAAKHDGYGDDWPISYEELAPYYDKVEEFIGISGSYENLPQLPDSKFLPPMSRPARWC
jgi:hypothetical protein